MARLSVSLNDAVTTALDPIVERISAMIAERVAAAVRSQLASVSANRKTTTGVRRTGRPTARHRRSELTRWVADRRARRVPTFVIEQTGLDTKKKIVAKYGADTVFSKGKPLQTSTAAPAPKAKPPIIRKKAVA